MHCIGLHGISGFDRRHPVAICCRLKQRPPQSTPLSSESRCRCGAHTFLPQRTVRSSIDHDVWGASMSVLEMIIFTLILIWTPSVLLVVYLTRDHRATRSAP